MITTTLNRIWAAGPCDEGKARALAAAGKTEPDDEPIPFAAIVDAVGLWDALWCCRAEPQHAREWRLYAVWCARQVQHLLTDQRSIDALDVATRYANGAASEAELAAARAAAWAVGAVAWVAWYAARDAAWAAARAAARAVGAAGDGAAVGAAQRSAFIQLVTTGTLP